ncbi:MAG: VCBS repeat-containing protein, partial [Candidatus Methanoperedens sp.]|nr:VCBS repeat-containing protein [Candidatus Methanoperedens sp.]
MKTRQENKPPQGFKRPLAFVLILFLEIMVVSLILHPQPVFTNEERMCGDLTFMDSSGNLIFGTIEINMTGAPGDKRSNVSSISWKDVPNARISFDALETKNISLSLRISGDSHNSNVVLENYGTDMPANVQAPGKPVKYVEISAVNVSFSDASVSVQYTDEELKGLDEKSLSFYSYDAVNSTWSELAASVDAEKNILSATVSSLSVFSVVAKSPEKETSAAGVNVTVQGEVIDKNSNKLSIHIKKSRTKAGTISHMQTGSTYNFNDMPAGEYILFDASDAEKVSASFKIEGDSLNSKVRLENYRTSNPAPSDPPGTAIKYVDINAVNMNFSEAEIRIFYSDAELGGVDERTLSIAHYKNGAWFKEATSVDAENNVATATVTSLSTFALIASNTSYNATLFIYDTKNNADPSDDVLVKTAGLTNLPANGTTFDLGYAGSIYRNSTYSVELQIRPNNTYEFDADYTKETFFKAGVPFNTTDSGGAQYIINTTLVPKDGARTEDIYVHTSSKTNYSADASAYEVGTIDGDLDIIAIDDGNRAAYWFENGNSWSRVAIESTDPDGKNPIGLAVGDLDKDGDIDVAYSNDQPSIFIHENDGTPGGANWVQRDIGAPPGGGIPYGLAIAD